MPCIPPQPQPQPQLQEEQAEGAPHCRTHTAQLNAPEEDLSLRDGAQNGSSAMRSSDDSDDSDIGGQDGD